MLALARPFYSKSVYNVISTTESIISDVVKITFTHEGSEEQNTKFSLVMHLLYIQYTIFLLFK